MTTWYFSEVTNHDRAQETCFQYTPTLLNYPQNFTHHRCTLKTVANQQ
jgi:hypothetical protein